MCCPGLLLTNNARRFCYTVKERKGIGCDVYRNLCRSSVPDLLGSRTFKFMALNLFAAAKDKMEAMFLDRRSGSSSFNKCSDFVASGWLFRSSGSRCRHTTFDVSMLVRKAADLEGARALAFAKVVVLRNRWFASGSLEFGKRYAADLAVRFCGRRRSFLRSDSSVSKETAIRCRCFFGRSKLERKRMPLSGITRYRKLSLLWR